MKTVNLSLDFLKLKKYFKNQIEQLAMLVSEKNL